MYLKKFKRIDKQRIAVIESRAVKSSIFFSSTQEEMLAYKLYLNPFIEIIETPVNVLNFNSYLCLNEEDTDTEITIACIPQSFFEGYKEVELNQICINIIFVLYENGRAIDFHQLKQKVISSFEQTNDDEQDIESLFMARLKYLVGNNLIYVE